MDKEDNKSANEKKYDEIIQKLNKLKCDLYHLGMEPLSILLGFEPNKIQHIYNEEGRITYKLKNNIDIALSKTKEMIELFEQNKNKIKGDIPKKKVEKYIEDAKVQDEIQNLLSQISDISNTDISSKFSYLIRVYMEKLINVTTFKNRNFKENNSNAEEAVEIEIYFSVKEKLYKMKELYSEYTIQQIINTLLDEKSEQFLTGKSDKTLFKLISDSENVDEMIEEYQKLLINIEKENDRSPKDEFELALKTYGINQKDLAKILGCSISTIERRMKENEVKNIEKDYYLKLKQINSDLINMKKILEDMTDEKDIIIINKITDRINSEEFQKLECIKELRDNIIEFNNDIIKATIALFTYEKSLDRKQLQKLIDEDKFGLTEHENQENKQTLIIKLFPEVKEKLSKLSFIYCKFSMNEIINTLLEKKLDQYVKYRVSTPEYIIE